MLQTNKQTKKENIHRRPHLHWHAVRSGVPWDANPSPCSPWGTNLRGGTMCFVACQKQSLPAHYIYSLSCSSCNTLNSIETEIIRVLNNPRQPRVRIYSPNYLNLLWLCFIPHRLKQTPTYLEGSGLPPLPSCPLFLPTRPLFVLFGHWRLSVEVYVQFTGAERSQFHVLLWNKTSLPLRSDEKCSAWAGAEQGAGPSPGGDQQWGSQSGFCVAAVGCMFGNYPLPRYEHKPGFPREVPALPPVEERTTHRQQRLTSHNATETCDPGDSAYARLLPVFQTLVESAMKLVKTAGTPSKQTNKQS